MVDNHRSLQLVKGRPKVIEASKLEEREKRDPEVGIGVVQVWGAGEYDSTEREDDNEVKPKEKAQIATANQLEIGDHDMRDGVLEGYEKLEGNIDREEGGNEELYSCPSNRVQAE